MSAVKKVAIPYRVGMPFDGVGPRSSVVISLRPAGTLPGGGSDGAARAS